MNTKKNLDSYNYGITHGGRFHTDDVMCLAFIYFFNPNIKVKRVKEYKKIPDEDTIVFDIGFGEFDHHQEERRLNDEGVPYSAFGLLFDKYGKDYLKANNFKKIDEAFIKFKHDYVNKIDLGDNFGYQNVINFKENYVISMFNKAWYETLDNDAQFFKAVSIAEFILENWTRKVFHEIEN